MNFLPWNNKIHPAGGWWISCLGRLRMVPNFSPSWPCVVLNWNGSWSQNGVAAPSQLGGRKVLGRGCGGEEKAYGENSPMRIHSQILHVWDYLPAKAEKWLHSRWKVGKYSPQGAYGIVKLKGNHSYCRIVGLIFAHRSLSKKKDTSKEIKCHGVIPGKTGRILIAGMKSGNILHIESFCLHSFEICELMEIDSCPLRIIEAVMQMVHWSACMNFPEPWVVHTAGFDVIPPPYYSSFKTSPLSELKVMVLSTSFSDVEGRLDSPPKLNVRRWWKKSGDHLLIWVNVPLFTNIYKVSCIPGGAGFLPSTVSSETWWLETTWNLLFS